MVSYHNYTDQVLATLLKSGDRDAFTEIFNRYSALLYKHTFNKIRNAEEARDIVQEIFGKVWSKQSDLDLKTLNLKGYLFAAARNSVFDLIRRQSHADAYAESYSKFTAQGVAETDYLIREKQFMQMIEEEIALLPPRMREVFELRRTENLSAKEIAERLNISENTVKDQMKKAVQRLRPRIGFIIVMVYFM